MGLFSRKNENLYGTGFWIGVVEDVYDPLQMNRVRARIIGYHSPDKTLLPTEVLPWASVLLPTTEPGQAGVVHGLLPGSWVVGFFMDGPNSQDPTILSTISQWSSSAPSTWTDSLATNRTDLLGGVLTPLIGTIDTLLGDGWGSVTSLFSSVLGSSFYNYTSAWVSGLPLVGDWFSSLLSTTQDTPSDATEAVSTDGTSTTTVGTEESVATNPDEIWWKEIEPKVDDLVTGNSFFQPPLATPNGYNDPRNGINKKVYPFYPGESEVHRLGRSDVTVYQPGGDRHNKERDKDPILNQKVIPFNPIYPHNKATVSDSGHITEYDDTPGFERIRIQHKAGTGFEIGMDGTEVVTVKNDKYEVIHGNDELRIRGNCNVYCDTDVTLSVAGHMRTFVGGDYSLDVGGVISVTSGEGTSIGATKNLTLQAGEEMSIRANETLEIFAQNDVQFRTNQAMTLGTGTNMIAQSNGLLLLNGQSDVYVDSNATLHLQERGADAASKAPFAVIASPIEPHEPIESIVDKFIYENDEEERTKDDIYNGLKSGAISTKELKDMPYTTNPTESDTTAPNVKGPISRDMNYPLPGCTGTDLAGFSAKSQEFLDYLKAIEIRNGLPCGMLYGLMQTESNFNPLAKSPVGARGLFQFMPATAKERGMTVIDPNSNDPSKDERINPCIAATKAGEFLRWIADYSGCDWTGVLHGYNGGHYGIKTRNCAPYNNAENKAYPGKVFSAMKGASYCSDIPVTKEAPVAATCSEFKENDLDYDTIISAHYKLRHISTATKVSKYKIIAQQGLTQTQIACNLKNYALNICEPLYEKWGTDFFPTCGFRQGSGKSQHNRGEAVDWQFGSQVPKGYYYDAAQWIKENLYFDQLLLEYKTFGTGLPWIHISFSSSGNQRQQILTMMNGKTVRKDGTTGLFKMQG